MDEGSRDDGYRPLDLSRVADAGLDALDTRSSPPTDEVSFHGIPFRVAGGDEPRFVLLEPGGATVDVPVDGRADRLIVAHRRLRHGGAELDPPPGSVQATYTFHMGDGTSETVPIRERIEIVAAADEGWDATGPFAAVGSGEFQLPDRHHGGWDELGVRQTEIGYSNTSGYFLWVWQHLLPEVPISRIELAPGDGSVIVAAITLGTANEDPFPTEAARTMRVTATGAHGPLSEPVVEVDRGEAGYAFRLPARSVQEYLDDPRRGFGEDADPESSSAYVRVAAAPSATVAVHDGADAVGRFRWGDLSEDGDPLDRDGIRAEVIETGRNWVHVTVLDEDTGKPVPCRVHFRSPEGVPYQPHGHHDHVNSDLGTWHIDVGGDLRLGRTTFAYIDGTCQGWLPRGDVIVDAVRGYEYEPLRQVVHIEPGRRELTLHLRRWVRMNEEGWYSGDSHVHFLSAQGSLLEQQGEDLNVVNLLQSQWGSLFTNTEDFTGGPVEASDGRYVTWVSQENRQPFFGHMVLWGLQLPVMPWCTDGPFEAELGSWQETTLSHWADVAHEQGATVVIPHFPQPNGEPATLIATGRADAVEMIVQRPAQTLEWYRYLNGGYPLPLVGGTDKMSSEVPVGLYRTYAYLGDEAFSFEAWTAAVRAGRTFVSAGPILRLSVDRHGIGDLVRLSGPGTVSVEAVAESVLPMVSLQLVVNGEVVDAVAEPSPARRLALSAAVRIDGDSWIAARCGGPAYFDAERHRDVWGRGIFAHTSPIYVACTEDPWSRADPANDERMRVLIESGLARIRRGRRYPEERITHHHTEADHGAFLERPFLEALDRVRARIETGSMETGSEPDR
ncbi:MAG: CehA/McbA family metallohydrolase [Actinomycetota bacterium]